jgi:TonB family protein
MLSILLGLLLVRVTAGEPQLTERTTLVPEGGPRASFQDGILEIRGSGGWLRTPRVFLDFRVAFEFKTTTAESDAGVLVRTWTGAGQWPDTGYRVRLPIDPAIDPAAVLVGHRRSVAVLEKGRIVLKSPGDWQHVEITGDGPRITILMNGTLVGVFEIAAYGGHVMFDNRKGLVQFRKITIFSTERPLAIPDGVMTEEQLKAAGGQSPKLIREVRPTYTSEAMRSLVQGRVDLEVVVLPDGSTGAIRVKRSLDHDLDLSAIAAVRAWKFTPAVVNGTSVPLLVEVEITFTLK